MQLIEEKSIVDAWKKAKELIIKTGTQVLDDDDILLEVLDLFLIINQPETSDQEFKVYDKDMKKWMLENFREIKRIPELHNTKSYGWRFYDNNGKNQIKWVIDKLKKKPTTKSATIVTIQPEDEEYIPCVSLLDFKLRSEKLLLSVTCRSLDFNKKALYNLYALSDIAHDVARELQVHNLVLKVLINSAHIYKKDL
ncbi:MAG: thymidylate synthase [Candidatus Helarchaeota archaeon]